MRQRKIIQEESPMDKDYDMAAEDDTQSASETGKKIKRIAKIGGIVLLCAFLVVHVVRYFHDRSVRIATEKSASEPPLVNVVTIAAAPEALPLKLPGETAAWYESTIYARVDGYVGSWNVDIGDIVKKDQVLAIIETPDLDAQLAASQAKLNAAQALVTAREADELFAKTTYERWRNSPKGVVSEQEREAKKAGYDSAVAQLTEAQAQVALDKADVDRYDVLTKFKQVLAPFDGVITQRQIDIGNLVTAGSNASTTPLYKISQNDPIRVFVDVPQNAANDTHAGIEATIAAGNRTVNGKVTRTANALDPQARTLKVEVDIPNHDQTLVPGMYVDVTFNIANSGFLQIPAAALIFRTSGPEVAVIDQDKKVSFQPVNIARDNGSTVEIESKLKVGQIIALNINSQIREGETVNVANPS